LTASAFFFLAALVVALRASTFASFAMSFFRVAFADVRACCWAEHDADDAVDDPVDFATAADPSGSSAADASAATASEVVRGRIIDLSSSRAVQMAADPRSDKGS
jgi:hypothetical protein